MSTLPVIFDERLRRSTRGQNPKKMGGIYTLDLGQFQGPFRDKDYYRPINTNNKTLSRSFVHSRRHSLDYRKGASNHLTYIQENQQVDDAQSFKWESFQVQNEFQICRNKMDAVKNQSQLIRQDMQNFKIQMQKQLSSIQNSIMRSFKQLRKRLFDFSRFDNNVHLILVKREIDQMQTALEIANSHYKSTQKTLYKIESQFKGNLIPNVLKIQHKIQHQNFNIE